MSGDATRSASGCRRAAGRPAAPDRQAASWRYAECQREPWWRSAFAAIRRLAGSSRSPRSISIARPLSRRCSATARSSGASSNAPCAVIRRAGIVRQTVRVDLDGERAGRHAARGDAAIDVGGESEIVGRSADLSGCLKLARQSWFGGGEIGHAKGPVQIDPVVGHRPFADSATDRPVNRNSDNVRSWPRTVAASWSCPVVADQRAGLLQAAGHADRAIQRRSSWHRHASRRAARASGRLADRPSPSPRTARGSASFTVASMRFVSPVSASASAVNSLWRKAICTGRSGCVQPRIGLDDQRIAGEQVRVGSRQTQPGDLAIQPGSGRCCRKCRR